MNRLPIMPDILLDLGINFRVVGVMIVIFAITFVVLKRLLFQRVLRFMEEREGTLRRQTEEIRHSRETLEGMKRQYEEHIAKIEKEASLKLEAVLKESMEQGRALLSQAQAQAAQQVREAVAALQAEKTRAWSQMEPDLQKLVRSSVEGVLSFPVDGTGIDAAIRSLPKGGAP